jgi:hypothetical protein
MAILFPDVEPIIVEHLKTQLPLRGWSNVYVATKRAQPDDVQDKQVIINASYQTLTERMIRDASVVVEVFCRDYGQANELSFLVSALLETIVGDPIKYVEITLGPVRLADEAGFERRSMSVDLVVKGDNF